MAHLLKLSNDVKLADVAVPSFNNYITIYSSTTDVTDATYTVEEDGFLLIKIDVSSSSGNCFYRLRINNGLILQQNANEDSNYVYYTSSAIPVRKDDTIVYPIKSGESKGKKQLYLLRPR